MSSIDKRDKRFSGVSTSKIKWKYCRRKYKNKARRLAIRVNDSTLRLALASPKVKRILEVLFPEKRALSAGERFQSEQNKVKFNLRVLEVLFPEKRRRESSAFWKYCSRKNVAASQAHFGSTVPGKNVRAYRG